MATLTPRAWSEPGKSRPRSHTWVSGQIMVVLHTSYDKPIRLMSLLQGIEVGAIGVVLFYGVLMAGMVGLIPSRWITV